LRDSRDTGGKEYRGDPEPWETVIPLVDVPTVEEFPAEVFPDQLATFIVEAAAALSCPADYLAVPMLALAGAAIGASRALEIKHGWWERPSLYAAVIGPPGSAKTPALKLAASPIYAEQTRRTALHQREKAAFDEAKDGSVPKPSLSTIYVSDITCEGMAPVLRDNSRGVVLIRDELTAWVASMDQYRSKGRGSDRQFYLSAWAGEPVSVHRKNQEDGPIFVPHPFVAVIGGLPPDLLPRLRGERGVADGFFDRILPAYPEPPRATGENWAAVSEDAEAAWHNVLSYLWGLEQRRDRDGQGCPQLVHLNARGRKVWQQFTHELADEINGNDFPDCLRGPWSKLRGYCARLSLIVHYLWLATGGVKGEEIGTEGMYRGAQLVRYFQSHARKVYVALDADPEVEKARRLLEWITREQRTEFKRWEPYGDLKNMGQFPTPESLDEPLRRLVRHNYIRPQAPPGSKGRGRPPAPVYDVNPCMENHPVNPVNPGK
jgi:hypothetical protein